MRRLGQLIAIFSMSKKAAFSFQDGGFLNVVKQGWMPRCLFWVLYKDALTGTRQFRNSKAYVGIILKTHPAIIISHPTKLQDLSRLQALECACDVRRTPKTYSPAGKNLKFKLMPPTSVTQPYTLEKIPDMLLTGNSHCLLGVLTRSPLQNNNIRRCSAHLTLPRREQRPQPSTFPNPIFGRSKVGSYLTESDNTFGNIRKQVIHHVNDNPSDTTVR
jgi:hypothetical protein